MKKAFSITIMAALLFSGAPFSVNMSKATAKGVKILKFDTMVGVPQAFTGTQNPIRGIDGGGLPWAISSGSGQLKADGELMIRVRGLVFAAGPNTGSNTVPSFRAIVSCLKSDGTIDNVMTDPFPATLGSAASGGGDARIDASLSLPHPCIAPIIFVTSPGGAWFASTGN